jgi:hypothetical protein
MLFPDNGCMKNRNVKNLYLLYLKIYKSYVANFWDMLCVMLWLALVPTIAQSNVVTLFI